MEDIHEMMREIIMDAHDSDDESIEHVMEIYKVKESDFEDHNASNKQLLSSPAKDP